MESVSLEGARPSAVMLLALAGKPYESHWKELCGAEKGAFYAALGVNDIRFEWFSCTPGCY